MTGNDDFPQRIGALVRGGRHVEAIALVTKFADEGDGWSSLCLAEWKLTGLGMERDLPGAVALLEAAYGRGYDPAANRLITLYATGTGCAEQPDEAKAVIERLQSSDAWMGAQAALLGRYDEKSEYPCEVVAETLDIRLFRGVLHPDESNWIRVFAEPVLEPSFVEEPGTGRRIPHPVRTSDGMSFGPLNEDLVVNRINRRIARLSGTEYGWGEPLHVLRYRPGQQYRSHFDALPGTANQRQLTAILYCNDGYEGGETHFPTLDLTVRGEEGDMLLFANTGADGCRAADSEHAGLPIISGEKWIATRWIRQRRYHPWDEMTA